MLETYIDTSRDGPQQSGGFDAAVRRREEDYLDRWPLAREIYGIAVTGPTEWSVRVGVYGEWGTGKTSVLEFIATMATKDHHVVIRFDPWEHSSKESLWRSFVLTIFGKIEATLGTIKGAKAARAKGWMSKATGVITTVAGLVNQNAGKVIGASLDLVKEHFSFSRNDLATLHDVLGGKHIVVLIDDLDRTAPELVPEILFALKELMDIPGFSFVCAFDPMVVGKVLNRYNPGFGEGLSFLEKIIDYPRWLPPPPPDGLTRLALAESKRYSPYVPEDPIRDAVGLLPSNPRAVRQFVRLLALLRPQIERHYEYELNWPIILAANVLKVRHPRIAYGLLNDTDFWQRIERTSLIAKDQEEERQVANEINTHIDHVTSQANLQLTPIQRDEIKAALTRLYGQLNRWALQSSNYLTEQMEIAEAPHAVTWKEYDNFFKAWEAKPSKTTVQNWITKHAIQVERSELRVYTELFDATIVTYAKSLREADDKFVDTDKTPFERKAEALLALTECLLFDFGDLKKTKKKIGLKQLQQLSETVASLSATTSPFHIKLWPRTEKLLIRLIEQWTGDVSMLMTVIHPTDLFHFTHYEGPSVQALHKNSEHYSCPNLQHKSLAPFDNPGLSTT